MSPAPGESFGDLLKRFRQRAGLTQEELAERAELSPRGLIYLERGARRPHPGTVRRLGAALALDDAAHAALVAAARGLPEAATSRLTARPDAGDLAVSLGVPFTALIGRESDVAVAMDLVRQPTVRLLTVTGPGGVGKTRLAARVAADVEHQDGRAVAAVPLASLRDPALVLPTIAQGLGIREEGDRPIWHALGDALRDRELLLVLDNFEQLLAAGPGVGRLLAACPRLQVLVTSRAPLRIQGEQELHLAPLAVPDPASAQDVDTIARSPSAALFVERARAVRPTFVLTPAEASAVAEICRRLDGLPLAIELAAAHVSVLPPRAMLARLDARLPLLTRGGPDRPPRQRTMADAIAWSHDLLTPDEQVAFRRLAVFAGGWTLDAAAAICDGDPLDLMASLVDKSLVQRVEGADGEPRFLMLETIREFAAARLAAAGEAATIQRRHAEYIVALAEQADRHLLGPDLLVWLARLEAEFDNLRAVLAWSLVGDDSIDPPPVQLGARLFGALFWFWYIRCHITEGVRWAEAILAIGSDLPPGPLAGTLFVLASLRSVQGEHEEVRALVHQSLPRFREIGDDWKVAFGTGALGLGPMIQGDYARAESQFAEGLELARALGDDWLIAWHLSVLGQTALFQGDHERAADLLEASLELRERIGDPFALSLSHNDLARLCMARGDWERGAAISARHLQLSRDVGFTRGVATALRDVARLAHRKGEYDAALGLFRESLALAYEVGEGRSIAPGLEGLGAALTCRATKPAPDPDGHPDLACASRLYGAAAALRQKTGTSMAPGERAEYEAMVATVQAALGNVVFQQLWSEGERMPLDRVLLEATTTGR